VAVWGLQCYGVVTARALAPMPVLAELCLPLVAVGGFLIAYKVRRCPPHPPHCTLDAAAQCRVVVAIATAVHGQPSNVPLSMRPSSRPSVWTAPETQSKKRRAFSCAC
jgi:hypothetical protein